MRMTVKLNLHDWPKRGAFSRNEVDVEAGDDSEAIELGIMAGKQKWPGAKVKAYDVVRHKLLATTALSGMPDIPKAMQRVAHGVGERPKLGIKSAP